MSLVSSPLHPIEQIVQDGACMGCGFCGVSLRATGSKVRANIVLSPEADYFVPKVENWNPGDECGDFICPGIHIDMIEMARRVHGNPPDDYLLGTYHGLRVCHATDECMRSSAASGAVIPAVLRHLFETKRIEVAYCAVPGDGPYLSRGKVISSANALREIHGSIYHPVNFGFEMDAIVNSDRPFAFVGLPCEIAGLEMLKNRVPNLNQRHILSLGLFCGGINRFGGIAYYLASFNLPWSDVKEISYRTGPWPGKIRVTRKSTGETVIIPRIRGNSRWKILRYVIAFQGYWMLNRCRLCPDPISDFADIAVGDPHLQKYRERGGKGFSVTITRTKRGEELVQEMITNGKLGAETVGRDVIIDSQGYTIDNRRHLYAYLRVARFLRMPRPHFTLYSDIYANTRFRHYRYAVVDLTKLVLPKNGLIRRFYLLWQICEYLFITLTPSLIGKRLVKILRNR